MRTKELLRMAINLAPVFFLITTGCRSLPRCAERSGAKTARSVIKAIESQHVIEVNADGLLYDLEPHHKRRLLRDRSEVRSYLVTNIWGGFTNSGKTNMLIFVHGGLNDRDQGLQHFRDDSPRIGDNNYYPVFVVWPSGWRDTYLEHLLWVRQGVKMESRREKAFSLATSPFMLLSDLGRALTRLPMVVANNTRSDLETVVPVRKQDGGGAVGDYQQLVTNGFLVSIGDDYSLNSDRLLRDLSYNATLPVKYIAASMIDGLGKGAWDNMLRRTETVYPARMDAGMRERRQQTLTNQSASLQSSEQRPPPVPVRKEKRARRYEAAGLPALFELLQEFQQKRQSLADVTLVGHSMGAIILNRVVRDATMDFDNIVFMGAACSIEDFSGSVLPYLQRHTNTQFYGLSLHPIAEAGEWYLIAGDLVPRGSLLVWIDNFLANPATEQDRTLGRWKNLFRASPSGEPVVQRFFNNDEDGSLTNRLHFRAFSAGFGGPEQLRKSKYQWNERPIGQSIKERCNTPLSHGEFSELPYWTSNFWWKVNPR